MQVFRVVAYAGPDYQNLPRYKDRIGDLIDSASDILRHRFGLRLDLVEVATWRPPNEMALATIRAEFERQLPRPDADLLVGFIARPFPSEGARTTVAYQYGHRR